MFPASQGAHVEPPCTGVIGHQTSTLAAEVVQQESETPAAYLRRDSLLGQDIFYMGVLLCG